MTLIKYITIAFTALSFIGCNSNETKEEIKTSSKISNGIATSIFKVWGNCDMCKETIEGSLKLEGILKADWDVDTKIMKIDFDTTKISLDQIKKQIASVGYDNDKYKGDDKAYSELADCCQYDRK